MRRASLAAALIGIAWASFAEGSNLDSASNEDPAPSSSWYIAWNPAAELSFCDLEFGNVLLPILASNLEYGCAFSAGLDVGPHTAEVRASLGTSNGLFVVAMLQCGYLYRFAESFGWDRGLYAGAFLRYWSLYNPGSSVTTYNLGPYAVLGWRVDIDHFFVDLRLNQGIGVFSWSDQEHTSPAFAFLFSPLPKISLVMPTVAFNVGLRLP